MEKVIILKNGMLVEMTKERLNMIGVRRMRGFINKTLKHYIIEGNDGNKYEYYYNF